MDTIETGTPLEMLEIRLEKLNEAWSYFANVHDELLQTATEEQFKELEVEFSDYESRFFSAHSRLVQHIRKKHPVVRENSLGEQLALQQSALLESINISSKDCSGVQLPKLEVPSFSGDYTDWPSFRDIFLGSVDNKKTLTSSQELKCLKPCLRGDAANLSKHTPISEANYLEACERLEKRYDRVNLIVQSFIQSFLSPPSISSANVHTLRKISDGADEVIRGLNALGSNNRDP